MNSHQLRSPSQRWAYQHVDERPGSRSADRTAAAVKNGAHWSARTIAADQSATQLVFLEARIREAY